MKYMVLLYSHPEPWGHPVEEFTPEFAGLSADERKKHFEAFEALLGRLHENGELVGGEALGDPAKASLYEVGSDGSKKKSDGPYSPTKDHLAGFFLIEAKDQARADEIAEEFAAPGQSVELRPIWTGGE
ncbi:YciI family protein [Amycolatopsis sp. cmx-11-12]|uniref:YciI family protein n=1 Tax=Amycolatopsis sp. cmx-11-12 TaxID=2785795 RepID=UPI0039183864